MLEQLDDAILDQWIDQKANALDLLCLEWRTLQHDIADFMEEYCAHVGEKANELAIVQHEVDVQREKNAQAQLISEVCSPHIPHTVHSSKLSKKATKRLKEVSSPQEDLKSYYKVLLRFYHPDTQHDPKQKAFYEEMTKQITQAYHQQAYGKLWKIILSYKLQENKNNNKNISLKKFCYGKIDTCFSYVESEVNRLRGSEEYALKQRVLRARMAGHDLLRQIYQDMETEIIRLQQKLDYLRYREQLLVEAI